MIHRPTLLMLLLLFSLQSLCAQETPKTLLWKITGNQFLKPCYLYGTMHSSDKRVYYLGDSVYSSLGFCDGFVMEVDPGDLLDTFIVSNESEEIDIAYRQAVENDLQKKGPGYYKERKKELDSFFIKLRQRYDKLPARYFNRLERAYRRRMRNDMKTALDLYLFDLAKRQGKIMGGVEDITQHNAAKTEAGKEFDELDFLKMQKKKYADIEEWMTETYVNAELDKFKELDTLQYSKKFLSLMLYNRNDIMASRIDSLGKIRSTFCAVGCAHLPGDSGVIDLLRRRGFTVTPVFSSRKIEPGDIKIDNKLQEVINIYDVDSNYVVLMPGKPTWLTPITRKFFLKTYKELSNEILLMCGVYEDGKTYKTVDKEVEEIRNFYKWHEDLRLYNMKKISRQQQEGYEMNLRNRDGYIRLHIFCNNGKTYLFAAGSKEKDSLNSVRCENYLATYKMILDKPRRETALLNFEYPEKAFSVGMPVQPKKENVNGDETVTNEEVTLFSSIDIRKKLNYLVLVKEPFKGYFPGFDSSLFTQTLKEIQKGFYQKYSAEENVLLDGYPALKVKLTGEADGKSQFVYVVMALRENRLYTLTARGLAVPENETFFEKYFSSFHFMPYLLTAFDKQTFGRNLFSVTAPSPIYVLENKITASSKNKIPDELSRSDYYAFDSSTAASYGVTALALGKYYWAENETAFLNEYARFCFNDSLAVNNVYNNDSLLYNKIVYNGNTKGREILMKARYSNAYTRLRILQYADSVFLINMKGDGVLVTNENADAFFNSFRFISENPATGIFYPKTEKLITDLKSADSIAWAPAVAALKKGFKFPRPELQLLLNAILYNYPTDKIKVDITALLAQTIAPYAVEEETSGFIKTNYPLLRGKREDVRMLMFNILSASKNKAAYQVLKDYFLNDPPSPANFDIALSHFTKSPALASDLFPGIAVKIKDAYLAPVVLDLANTLIDSSQLQYSAISGYQETIIQLAKKMLKEYQDNNSESFYLPHITAMLQLLTKINDKKTNGLLDDFIDLQNLQLNAVIILSKVKNGQQVPEELFNRFCETPVLRLELYDELLKMGRQSFFKGKYANQQSFAEALAMIYTNNQISERVPKNFDVVAVKETMLYGTMLRFYVFKVKCFYTYENVSYSCMIGPFSTDAANLSINEGKERFILYKVKYDYDKIESLFNDFLEKVKKMPN
ncbi:MAG: TraB/GumN family protein [Chitinophagaceae bacterium]|nr:TraB/GumN family protein [Chitinophagaceae bacterium]